MGTADDLVHTWEVVERDPDGTTIRHGVGPQHDMRDFIKILRRECFGITEVAQLPIFYIQPYGLQAPDIDLARHQC